jgi:selenide,water dikinase
MVDMDEKVDPAMQDILYDPQTSGGLCIAVEPTSADALVDHLQNEGVEHAAVIGEVVDYPAGIIQLA